MVSQTSYGNLGLVNTQLNVNSAIVLKKSAGAVMQVSVTLAGSAAGGVYDCAATANATTGNLVATLPNTVGPVTISFPCLVGITVVPGSGQRVSVAYQ
jgi:hypothetical protein